MRNVIVAKKVDGWEWTMTGVDFQEAEVPADAF
jgi:hypothetical protein